MFVYRGVSCIFFPCVVHFFARTLRRVVDDSGPIESSLLAGFGFVIKLVEITTPKTNMEPNSGGLENVSPFAC